MINGSHVRKIRKDKKLSRREVAFATGLTENTVRLIETKPECNPTLKTIQALADFYSIPIAELLEEKTHA